MNINTLGFNNWFAQQMEQADPGMEAVRVIAVHRESYVVSDGTGDIYAETTGKLQYDSGSPLDLPAVGDWVLAQLMNDRTLAIIHSVLERKTLLTRKNPGRKVEFQLIGANIDTVMIMQALDSDFNPRRLERYLVMAREGGIEPVVLLSKRDLLPAEEVAAKTREAEKIAPGSPVLAFSNQDQEGLDQVKALFLPGITYCLLGSSGVGKTTLLNRFLNAERFETRSVRVNDGKGRHTTTSRQLIMLDNGAMVIDTPGMRELGAIAVDSGLEETFDEIVSLSRECRFKDCSHEHEDSCAVLAALAEGEISRERYDSYLKLKKESDFHERSYLERRRNDKAFGKMVKSVKKDMKKSGDGR